MTINPRYEQIKNFTIIKRDGREEPFYLDKLIKVITWACEDIKNSDIFIEKLLDELALKIVDKMRIQDLYDELIDIAVSKISALYPMWDSIAKYLYLLKIYKENFNLKRIGTYPSLNKFLSIGIKREIYDKNIIDTFTEDEIDEISTYIDPNRDLLFNYKGLRLFFNKYCKSFSGKLKKKKLELPQITFISVAIHSHYNEPHTTKQEIKERLRNIKKTYDLLSTFKVTFSTPRLCFGLVPKPQFASCVLITAGDDTLSLNTIDSWAAIYSKYMGGIAVDFSYIRTRGSVIKANNGLSDGPIPFIKRLEQTVSSFNQAGCLAKGSLVEVVDSVEFSDGSIEDMRYKYKIIEQKINKEIHNFIDSKLIDLQFHNCFISKEQLKEIWIKKMLGISREEIIEMIPNLTIDLYKRHVAKYINSFDYSTIENFKPVFGLEDHYLIHKDGTIINRKYGDILQHYLSKKGYVHVAIFEKRDVSIHRLLYETFIGKIPDNMTVDHIDNNKLNNSIDNFQLLSSRENAKKNVDLLKNDRSLNNFHRKIRVKRFLCFGYKFNGYRTLDDKTTIVKINTIQIPIEKTLKTDVIKCYNVQTQEVEFRKILEKFEFDIPLERQYILRFENGVKLITSDHHPIFYRNQYGIIEHKRADEMKIGDNCITSKNVNTKLVSIEKSSKEYKFYDLTVFEHNNYFAAYPDSNVKESILVHNTRAGKAIVYFQWWNMDVEDLIMLKDAGGAEENRARRNQYSIKINRLLLDRADKDEYITLFDPKETWILNEINGKEFEKKYIEFENNANIRSKKIKARRLIELFFKVRVETGNLYCTFMDNINEQEMTGRYIGMSNLCNEIVVPSRKPEVVSEKYYKNQDGKFETHIIRTNGEIGLCNLSSIDSHKWFNLKDSEKDALVYTLLKGMDNSIDSQFYPVSEGALTNKTYRPIGIGITNFANLVASQKLKYSDDNILQFMNDLMDDIYYRIYKFSVELAKERGAFEGFRKSTWAKGLTPFHLSILRKKNPFNLKFNDEKWNELGKEISKYGVRFSLHAAIPPSATSSKIANATEACEPILDLFYYETGTNNLPTVVSGIKEYGAFYERCWDIDPKRIIELAAIRQIYLDQSQSFNQYYKKAESLSDLYEDLRYAESLGIKSLYYFKQPKSEAELECSSCSV